MASQLEDIYAKKRPKENKGFKITSSKKKRNKHKSGIKQPKNAFTDDNYMQNICADQMTSPKFTVDAMLDDLNFDNRPPSRHKEPK